MTDDHGYEEEDYDLFSSAAALLDAGMAGAALDTLAPAFDDPHALEPELPRVLELLARSFALLNARTLETACRDAARDVTDAEALHRLGFQLVEHKRPVMAVAMLSFAHSRAPRNPAIIEELVAALELVGRYDEARRYLADAALPGFLPGYLLAFNTLMSGDIEGARRRFADLKPGNADELFMHGRLDRMFQRIRAIETVSSFGPSDHRAWHFALTGGVLLHVAPADRGLDGGYASLEDSNELCHEGIKRLVSVLDAWALHPPEVLYFDNPDSERFGLACADALGVPASKALIPDRPCLFVAYGLASIIPEVRQALAAHLNGIMIYSHASLHTTEQPITTDFTTLHYASLVSPWNRHTIFPWREGLPTSAPTASAHELAQDILATPVTADALQDLPQLVALARACRSCAAALRTEGTREKQWVARRR
jgi:hypothetical protein